MRSASRRGVGRKIGAAIVTVLGAAVGVLIGYLASVGIWNLGWGDSDGEEAPVAALVFVLMFVVPITTATCAALALRLYWHLERPAPRDEP